MSYDIDFRVKVEGIDAYISVGECEANVTWNLREMIVASTGLEWENEANNGLCLDVIPHIRDGLSELERFPDKYKQYESPNGWGTIDGCRGFFRRILRDWDCFCEDYSTKDLINVATFWII